MVFKDAIRELIGSIGKLLRCCVTSYVKHRSRFLCSSTESIARSMMSADGPVAREMEEGGTQIPSPFEEPVDLKAFELLDDIYNMVGHRSSHRDTVHDE